MRSFKILNSTCQEQSNNQEDQNIRKINGPEDYENIRQASLNLEFYQVCDILNGFSLKITDFYV